ncbi:unnamed protein product [Auanema sp. JU1783]|nr:unnamed protein product [Auanema sp. JU1783]
MSDAENDSEVRRSTRVRAVKKNQSALEALKEARRTGKVYKPNVEDLVKNVYDEVDDEEYNEIIRSRQAVDFVVDDDGGGYVDHGDDFMEENEEDGMEEQSHVSKAKAKKEKKKRESRPGTLSSFFNSATNSNRKMKDESEVKLGNDALLDNLLLELNNSDEEDEQVMSPISNSQTNPFLRGGVKRAATDHDVITPRPIVKKVALTSRATPRSAKLTRPVESVAFSKQSQSREPSIEHCTITTNTKTTTTTTTQSERDVKAEPLDEDDDDFGVGGNNDDDDFAPEPVNNVEAKTIHVEKVKHEIDEEIVEPEVKHSHQMSHSEKEGILKMLNDADWVDEVVDEVKVTAGTESFYEKENDEQFVRMYYLDAFEDPMKHSGTVYLFGRVMKTKTVSASCCLVLKNIQRQVFILPRATRIINGVDTKEAPTDVEIYEEIKSVLSKHAGVGAFKCKKVAKKFMYNGTVEEKNYDKENDVFEVRYNSLKPKLPTDLSGETFSAVFNTTTTPLERLFSEQRIMGPSWISVHNYTESSSKVSYCDYEFNINMESSMSNIRSSQASGPMPTSRILVLNVLTTLNEAKGREICMISSLYNANADIQQTVDRGTFSRFTLFCKPPNTALPFDIKEHLEKLNVGNTAQSTVNEKALLCLFLAKIQKWEPDIIVGHDLQAMMDLLKLRLQKLNVPNWSRMSRLKRSVNLSSIKSNKAGQWEFTAGRALMDSRVAAMETVRCRSYDLSELSIQIMKSNKIEVYPHEVPLKYANSTSLFDLIRVSWMDALLAFQIVERLNALPLYLQITEICGGIFSRTLMGGRAERNEFLLLHAFHRANVIAPNKFAPSYSKDKSVKSEPDEAEAPEDSNSKKAQYSGGLVLDPKKGLYDTLILLLDFNSLYPSIIQEYNICFTTVKHNKDGDNMPDAPPSGVPEGILPKEIRILVDRRRQVKNMMKDSNLSEATRKQYDIRQMALKLTANSMYGCLGFKNSRFYAKPLAALVTSKGREILMNTKNLVERMGFSVVYGDTDSIMVNTNGVDIGEAKKLAVEIRKQVNQTHKILELGLDGIFKRMLLLKKKKYAALAINPDNTNEVKKELKGLDIVRRDWSLLARDSGTEIVGHILNSELTREELVTKIRSSLESLRKSLDNGENDLRVFEISKQLTRNPSEYHDLKAQPHAAVASRLNATGKFAFKVGDIIEYIICEDGTNNSSTQRAYHRSELEDNKNLKIDVNYYLSQQVHPVVSRLCAPIEETDSVFIAEALGLDTAGYRRSAAALQQEHQHEEASHDFNLNNFDHCESFSFPCPGCGVITHIRSAFEGEDDNQKPSLHSCSKCNVSFMEYEPYLLNLLDNQLSNYIAKHLKSAFRCDEATCSYKTHHYELKWSKEGLDCSKCGVGILRREYTAKHLFDQQSFFKQIFNVSSVLSKMKIEEKRQMEAHYCSTIVMYEDFLKIISRYLRSNSYNRVNLAYLFAPMMRLTV